ncbi:MAG: hypothetical protein ACPG4T_22475, partial [Nannocystaceae bacterium]
ERLVGIWASAPEGQARALWEVMGEAAKQLEHAQLSPRATVEIFLASTPRELQPRKLKRDRNHLKGNIHRGLRALEVTSRGETLRIDPFTVVTRNQGHASLFAELHTQLGQDEKQFFAKGGSLRFYGGEQYVVYVDKAPRARALYRASRVVEIDEIDRAGTELLGKRLGDYLISHVADSGALTYLIDPAKGEDILNTNNMIRQWMATIAMSRVARFRNDPSIDRVVERNIRHNLTHFYRDRGPHAVIDFRGVVKLGAISLAALALIEAKTRHMFTKPLARLCHTIDHMWDLGGQNGAFKTMLAPNHDTRGSNFYPGETLLMWAYLLKDDPQDPERLRRFMLSYKYYRTWHLEHRNPAFIPWHTQAYFMLWEQNQSEELRDWIFEMNDWLLSMQQQPPVNFPDIAGRFYDPKRPKFGNPHASSTGVYLEGLIDAFELARRCGDKTRQENYRRAIVWGLRSVMQLTFLDRESAFYALAPERCVGGTRTSVYRNEIRCDNVQHSLMGILKVLTRFEETDYRP